ncbi:NUDIX domain-containing protein [Kitasatospora sp. NPDC059571]|uniref:NUDIX domain-containing protein n=1 Tax=Kitasatospora sp. NPDC059571 TaxID=3346871 RepID=UPI003691A3BE
MNQPAQDQTSLGVNLLLYREDGRVLLGLRSGTRWADGYWSVPAGHLQGEETVPEAAVREAREELGIGIDPADLVHAVTVDYREGSALRALTAFLTARRWTGTPSNLEPGLCRRLGWFPPDRLPRPVTPISAAAIAASARNRGFETCWLDGPLAPG